MSSLRTPGRRPWQSTLALILFLLNLNCFYIPDSDRSGLSPKTQSLICKTAETSDFQPFEDYQTPTQKVRPEEYPFFEDDLDFKGLEVVLQRQLKRFGERRLSGTISFGPDRYSLSRVRDSLVQFGNILKVTRQCLDDDKEKRKTRCLSEFRIQIEDQFNVYKPLLGPEDPRFGQSEPVLYTGYYTAHLEVSLWPTSEYRYPIYAKPSDEWYSRSGRYNIDFQNVLKGMGLELYYAKDLFSIYLLHLEGGGRVTYRDQRGNLKSSYISYAGSNGRQWRFLSTLMLERNWITNPAVPFQRQFIVEHPELEAEIFSYCPSYIYFRPTSHPPEGSDLVPLTNNRSIATDKNHYAFKGVLAFVKAKRPRPFNQDANKEIQMMPFSRFVLDQDTGGAIRGKGRVDFYFGEDEYAELAANTVKERGDLFFLMLKD